MTPDSARATLDRWLLMAGQAATLQRLSAPSLAVAASVDVQVHVSDFAPKELDGANGLQIGDSKVIMSATEVNAAQWPSAAEARIPRKGDRLIVAGRTRTVLYGFAAPYVGGELVRIELTIR
jgi:hypothetical protein